MGKEGWGEGGKDMDLVTNLIKLGAAGASSEG